MFDRIDKLYHYVGFFVKMNMINIEGRARKAVTLYSMIDEGDSVAVGVSGGKDSVALLTALAALRRYSSCSYTLTALSVDPLFFGEAADYSSLASLCDELGVELLVKQSDLYATVFDSKQVKSPCSLCARMRRGMLHDMAVRAGCNKLALGHNMNDAVETLFLNLFHEGRIESFKPKTYLSRKDITVIRPLLFCTEDELRTYVRQRKLPVTVNRCPVDGQTEREQIKRFIANRELDYPGFLKRTFYALRRSGISGY